MPRKTKRILVTTETHEVLTVFWQGSQNSHGFCDTCQKEVELVTVKTSSTPNHEQANLYESLHVIKTDQDQTLICQQSLNNLFEEEQGEQQ